MDRFERKRAIEREQAEAGRQRMAELRACLETFIVLLCASSDVPRGYIGTYVGSLQCCERLSSIFLPVIIAIKFALAEFEVDPCAFSFFNPWHIYDFLSINNPIGCSRIPFFIYMVIRGKSKKTGSK